MQKKKILVFINYFGKKSETFISDEIDFLSKQDSIDFSVLHYGSSMPEKNIAGVSMPLSPMRRWTQSITKLNVSVLKSLKYKNGLNGSLAFFIAFFKKNHFDTIYCHFGTNGKIVAQLKELGVIPSQTKVVVRFHGLDMLFSKYPVGYYDVLNKYASKIIVGSDYAYKVLLDYKIEKKSLTKLPVGIKRQNISSTEFGNSHKPVTIISIGRLIELKGHLISLEIARELDRLGLDFFYTIIGDGPQYNQICETIQKYNLQARVEVIRGLEHTKVLEKLQASQIYLYPGIKDASGRVETQGLANLEAMAKGLVIVASDVGGVPDYVKSDKTGFLCQPGMVQEFVKKLAWVMNEYCSDEIEKIRQNAIEIVLKNYCQEALNDMLLDILKD